MPELPEVETLKNALRPLVEGKVLLELKFFREDIRFPIPQKELLELAGSPVTELTRLGKYILLTTGTGSMLWHLGMSGRVTQRPSMEPQEKHTHAVFKFETGVCLHFIDPRRFGCILWIPKNTAHPLIAHLGPDPLADKTTAEYLKASARKRTTPIKSFLMDSRRLAGVGNIYACESLFAAGIHPKRPAGRLSLAHWEILLQELRHILQKSIHAGGTTLKDFFNADGTKGYFSVQLSVYGREGLPCPKCKTPVSRLIQSGRSTFYCKSCQKR